MILIIDTADKMKVEIAFAMSLGVKECTVCYAGEGDNEQTTETDVNVHW